ncbi:hypothetical protein [Rhizobium leguminosarum]|uniref:hypothetical protein n=1 Tax=Rhizobium leguminosarum TaxID=384 RepID=UPI001DBF110D|nr:hypothetical protein [Rhizobium leguminosarum]MBP2449618.1 hypothetical protein [Rhizobium leguminosarum]
MGLSRHKFDPCNSVARDDLTDLNLRSQLDQFPSYVGNSMTYRKEPILSISDANEEKLCAAVIAVQSALWVAIDNLSKIQEDKGQKWFDDLEEVALDEAKGTVTIGISIETEAESLKFGIDVLKAILRAKRIQLGFSAKT